MRPSRINRAISFSLLICTIFLPACTRESQKQEPSADITIELTVDPSPASIGDATLFFELKDAHNYPIEGASLNVKGDMSHAGMIPVLGESLEIGDGNYSIPFEWAMGGDWILTVAGELPNGQSFIRTFEVTISSD